MRDLHGRVKRARAVVANTPGLAETLAGNWQKATMFYARIRITEATLLHGVPGMQLELDESHATPSSSHKSG